MFAFNNKLFILKTVRCIVLSEQEKSIYSKLYDRAYTEQKDIMKDYDKRKYIFLKLLELPPGEVTSSFLYDIPKQYFLEAAYMIMLRRWPEEHTVEVWKKQNEILETFEYKKAIILKIVNSLEFQSKEIKFVDTIFEKKYIKGKIKKILYSIYLKLPSDFQELLKKLIKNK